MASPITTGSPAAYGWPPAHPNQQQQGMPAAHDTDEMGVQLRPMALKVLYTFDKDNKVNCLARLPQTLQVQVIPIDERSWIGIVDLRLCIQAITQGSPELASQAELDYAIYAVDCSEPDSPLVGQGMLSWILDPTAALAAQQFDDSPKMVTGRVTKNMMALFGNGVRETLEVRLKLSEVARAARMDSNGNNASQNQMRGAPTPTDTTEWNSFLQANPMLGRSASIATMQSPSTAPALPDMSAYPPSMPTGMAAGSFDMGAHAMSRAGSRPGSRQSTKSTVPPSYMPAARPGASMLAQQQQSAPSFASASPPPLNMTNEELLSASTSLPEATPVINPRPSRPSRPSSRSSRSRAPTGRPRGRPRKSQPTDGNTSAAEEAPTDADADGDDGHKKKRVKTTKADYPVRTSLDSAPDSLRVAASTSGALRTLRPILPAAPATDGPSAQNSHLHEFPRAPTPVPQGGPPSQHHARKMIAQKARRESMANLDPSSFADHSYPRSVAAGSPTDSIAPSPENYTPEDSPADIGSSPPVPRTTSYVPQSSPIPSSPPLPAMRRLQPDSGFMSGGMDDLLFDDDENALLNDKFPPPPTPLETAAPTPNVDFSQPVPATAPVVPAALPPQASTSTETEQPAPAPTPAPAPAQAPAPAPAPVRAPAPAAPRPSKSTNENKNRANNARTTTEKYPFLTINPGPPELLPTTVLYNPPPPPKGRTKNQRANSMVAKAPPPQLERSHSEPAHLVQLEQEQQQQNQHQLSQLQQQAFPLPSDAITEGDSCPPKTSAFPGVDVPDDMKELAKLLAASNDGSRDSEANGLSRTSSGEPAKSPQAELALPQQPEAGMARMANSLPPLPFPSRAMTVPASDPPALPPLTLPAPPPPPTAFSEAPCPPSDADVPSGRSSKNLVRKAAIRERLKQAIESGETPPYCQNCGAIETPTWRKMWTQDHDGEPGHYDLSDKSNPISFIEILERDADGKSTRYRLVRKALSSSENGKLWTQMLLCNPCGIWLGKFRSHRPRDRWDKDLSRLNQSRNGNFSRGRTDSRSRKSRTKSDPQSQLTSEAYFTTDPVGPEDAAVPNPIVLTDTAPTASASQQANAADCSLLPPALTAAQLPLPQPQPPASTTSPKPTTTAESKEAEPSTGGLHQGFQAGSNRGPASGGGSAKRRRQPGSTHSRGSGTADSPIAVDDHFGTTRRLLFPSPRKDGVLKVLGELAVNVIGTVLGSPKAKASPPKFEDGVRAEPKQIEDADKADTSMEQDDMEDLFGTPPPSTRPSTPPPKSGSHGSPSLASGPFKTPTRPTPSHRPITRSVSKSIVRSTTAGCTRSPSLEGMMLLQRTPSKTPHLIPIPGSAGRTRRMASMTPGRQQQHHQMLHVPLQLDGVPFDTPLTSTLNQLLSEANHFTTGSPSHGLTDLDLASIAHLNSDDLGAGFDSTAGDIDFSSYLEADLIMPSSSPLLGRKNAKHHHVSFNSNASFEASENLWSDFNDAMEVDLVTERAEQTA